MNFITSLDKAFLSVYVRKQLNSFFPDDTSINAMSMLQYVEKSLERLFYSFSHIKGKYYSKDNNVFFNHLNGDHYCTFLYFLSNEAYKNNDFDVYQKVSLLNKHLFSVDIFGHIELPKIFLLVHPIGTIIGRAKFSDYLVIYQGVTIGGIHKENEIKYPVFEQGVVCYSGSSILGETVIGSNSVVAANTKIISGKYSKNSLVLGQYPNVVVKENKNQTSSFFKMHDEDTN